MTEMNNLTETDRAIIATLRRDARMSLTDLAQAVGISRTTARLRLQALIDEGHIRRFTVETPAEDDPAIRAITMVQLQGRMSRMGIRALNRIPEVTSVYATNGTWDLVVEIRATTLAEFDRVLREIREVPGVTNSESCLLLNRL